ncbi:MAG TPA: cbb3-type cytochrome c oxidase subunit 3 [Thermomonas sp.]|jgi:cytochrome c oxidase cbb3-type subunit 4|uniref:cbb3-type cytochrome oxidase subunit 3 n=1 Tax=Thermomonas sp. TaxID=1971895 RepID=UPI002CA48E34|nr:cbb3-type cytochrome c oxidase subunit 3 [Thermomonas sp.]MBS0459087.1 cbb3-type cytochrome c oxidase subunit 3 [Pseudomonadota bacterium]HOV96828.1 cbb3-type cytochrome c oxidase subunit 3 [Thermomonas sp.]
MISGIVTTVLMLLFIGVWIWAWQPRLRAGFDATARLAVDDAMPEGEDNRSTQPRNNA